MRELTQAEQFEISGAGFIINIAESVGNFIGDKVYAFVPEITVQIPILGTLDIKQAFPELGGDVGKSIGNVIGSGIENIISGIPLVGGLLNKIMGN